MLRIFLTLLLASVAIPCFAQRTITTQQPYFQPYYSHSPQVGFFRQKHNNSYFSDISALEKYALNKTYKRDSDLQRLQRLEMATFGTVQSGDLDLRYDRVSNAILSRPKQNFKTTLLRNLGNYLTGEMTGFTPPVTSFDNTYAYPYGNSQNYSYDRRFFPSSGFSQNSYPTTYDNGRIVEFGNGPFNRGYRYNNIGTGSSSGVTILD